MKLMQADAAELGFSIPTCQNTVLLQGLLPADLQGCVQDLTEAQVSHRARHCPKTPGLSTQPRTHGSP